MARPSTPEAAEFVTGRFTLRPVPPPRVVLAAELPELLRVVPPPGLLYETVGGVVPLLPSALPLAPPICSTWPLGLVRWPFAPHFTPSSRVESSLAITTRDSISTCCTGLSSTATNWRICSVFSAVSLSSRVLVRSSWETLPRADRKPRETPAPPALAPPPPVLCLRSVVSSLAISAALP